MHAYRLHVSQFHFEISSTKKFFIESSKKLVCLSLTRLPYYKALEVQACSEDMQGVEGNCLVDGYVSSLPEEVHVDLTQNKLTELAGLWEQVSGHIASLITVEVDEPLIRAVIQFSDPLYRCFTFNKEDLVFTAEEYSMLIRLKL